GREAVEAQAAAPTRALHRCPLLHRELPGREPDIGSPAAAAVEQKPPAPCPPSRATDDGGASRQDSPDTAEERRRLQSWQHRERGRRRGEKVLGAVKASKRTRIDLISGRPFSGRSPNGSARQTMAAQIDGTDANTVVTETTCGICLEEPKDPRFLPCGHSFCDCCLGEWRSRYGVKEEMRRKCPICRATIPPSKEMVSSLLTYRAAKQKWEDNKKTSSEEYHLACKLVEEAEEDVGADWDGVTVLEDDRKPAVVMPDYIYNAALRGDIKSVLKWISANTEDRVNAVTSLEKMRLPILFLASKNNHLTLMTLLLQLGADADLRNSSGFTTIQILFSDAMFERGDISCRVGLLLGWGATFIDGDEWRHSLSRARKWGYHKLADLFESELGGRRCEIVNHSSRPDLNGKTCVADEYLPSSNQYKVTLETKSKDELVLSPDNLKRRDRTPQDCGYYVEFKNGRTIRHDFDSNEDCQAFIAALNNGETQPAVTEEAEAAAEQAAAELLAELGLVDSLGEPSRGCKAKKSKKKKGGKKKRK
ncbi:hypothetical protein THAOC_25316, partial [Thalassiosira oceanica]